MFARMQWKDWLSVLLGAWLIASPWVLGFTDHGAALWNAVLFGAAIVLVEFVDVYFPDPWPERASLLLGLWIAISPMLLGFTGLPAAMWSTVVTGVIIVVLAAWTHWVAWHRPAVTSH